MAAVATAFPLLAVPSAEAKAPDQRPCVSLREYRGVDQAPRTEVNNRKRLEARWDVAGTGRRAPAYSGKHYFAWKYKACGYSRKEARVMVTYGPRNRTMGMQRWTKKGATVGAPVRAQ